MDVGNGVLQFERTILSASVKPVRPQLVSGVDQYDLFMFEIKGLGFLYHQVSRRETCVRLKPLHFMVNDICSLLLRRVSCCVVLQVRCMMALLLLIGQKLEAPEIINQLLDVQSNPRKPQYRYEYRSHPFYTKLNSCESFNGNAV